MKRKDLQSTQQLTYHTLCARNTLYKLITQQGDINMTDNRPIIDTSWELKWKRTMRRRAINILARIENDGKPTQELGFEVRKLQEAFTYWNSDVATWEKHNMVIPLPNEVQPQAELQQSQVPDIDIE